MSCQMENNSFIKHSPVKVLGLLQVTQAFMTCGILMLFCTSVNMGELINSSNESAWTELTFYVIVHADQYTCTAAHITFAIIVHKQ